jgi:cbb3-type cytochrome oxidase subunit 3
MRLSELVSNLTPSAFAQVALVLFLAVFAAVTARALGRNARAQSEAQAALPLHDDAVPAAARGEARDAGGAL